MSNLTRRPAPRPGALIADLDAFVAVDRAKGSVSAAVGGRALPPSAGAANVALASLLPQLAITSLICMIGSIFV